MANTIFVKGRMQSEHNVNSLFSVQNTVDMQNGSHVVLGAKLAGNLNTYAVSSPVDVTKEQVLVVDSPVIIEVNGLRVDLEDPTTFIAPANRPHRARALAVNDTLTISVDGFSSAPTVGQYAVPKNGAYKLDPAVDLTGATALAYIVEASTKIYVGASSVTAYKLRVVKSLI